MQQTYNLQLIDFKKEHTTSIIDISKQQMGDGFLNEESLKDYLENPQKHCQVIQSDSLIVGFSLMEINSVKNISKKLKSAQAWFLDYFDAYDKIGYRSVTAVHPDFEGLGIASKLVKDGLLFLAQQVPVVVCDAWKSTYTHIGQILERSGYQKIREIDNYWTTDSINQIYNCSHCGAPPCICTAVIYAVFFDQKEQAWWERKQLRYINNVLHVGNTNLKSFTANKKTPLYIYDVDRVIYKYKHLYNHLSENTSNFQLYYAMKANRHVALLTHLKIRTNIGIDVCSPNELKRALQLGFREENISYTGTSLSNRDLDIIRQHPDIKINFDALSSLKRYFQIDPKRKVGIRINTNVGMAYAPDLEYAGNSITKFGIYESEWEELLRFCRENGVIVERVHFHGGSGFLTPQLNKLPHIFEKIDRFLSLFPDVKYLNIGGGLGVPQKASDEVLNIEAWANQITKFTEERGLHLSVEPGDYLVKDAGILISEVTTVETKSGINFVGLDCGMNINNEYAYYKMNLETVPMINNQDKKTIKTTLFGNINEPVDLFAEGKMMPPLKEGDYVALINSGGYGASTSSNHCMRGDFDEYIISK